MPDPQARRLVGDHPVADVLDREWEPVSGTALGAPWPSVSELPKFRAPEV